MDDGQGLCPKRLKLSLKFYCCHIHILLCKTLCVFTMNKLYNFSFELIILKLYFVFIFLSFLLLITPSPSSLACLYFPQSPSRSLHMYLPVVSLPHQTDRSWTPRAREISYNRQLLMNDSFNHETAQVTYLLVVPQADYILQENYCCLKIFLKELKFQGRLKKWPCQHV